MAIDPDSPLILVSTVKKLSIVVPERVMGEKRISQYSLSLGVVRCRFILLPDCTQVPLFLLHLVL